MKIKKIDAVTIMFGVLLLFLVVSFIAVPVSAANFDNKKSFDKDIGNYGKVTIKDWFGLQDLTELELKENTDICAIDCSAEIEIVMHQKGILIDSIRFMDVDNREKSIRNYELYVDGELYNLGDKVEKGIYNVVLKGSKDPYETIDWQITSQGKLIDEWALWLGADGPRLAFNFDEVTTTNVRDLVNGSSNGTYAGTLANVTGILGRALRAEEFDNVNVSYVFNNKSDLTIQLWIKTTTGTSNPLFGSSFAGAPAANHEGIYARVNDNILQFGLVLGGGATAIDTTNVVNTGTWQHIIITWDSSDLNASVYINASREVSAARNFGTNLDGKFAIFGAPSSDIQYAVNDTSIDEFIVWDRLLTPTEITELYNSGSGLEFGSAEIGITLNLPPDNNSTLAGRTNYFNCSSEATSNINNISLYTNSTGSFILNQTIDVSGDASTKTTQVFDLALQPGGYIWTCESCSVSEGCSFSGTNRTINVDSIELNSITFNTSTVQTATENFVINITTDGTTPTGTLYYNGTNYAPTITGTGTSYQLQRQLTIPTDTGLNNKTFIWHVEVGSDFTNFTRQQNVSNLSFSFCESGAQPFINFTFKDEDDNSAIQNGTIPSSTWTYFVGDGSVNKTYSFINNTGNPSYSFCGVPTNRNITIDASLQYEDQEGNYIQRLIRTSRSLSNATTNTTLYLLKSADGIYVTFQVINQAEQQISGVSVTGTRSIGGETVTVATGTTDAAGSVTFFLNPNFEHTFNFEATGFDTTNFITFPTQSSYTIQLGTTSATSTDFSRGISYVIKPELTQLLNDTTYSFNYTLTSSFWQVTQFGFDLKLANGTILDTVSATTNGGTVNINYNTGNLTNIVMAHYYTISGNSTNGTRTWTIYNTELTEWSISTFFTDLQTYLTAGLFGLDDFGLHLIVYIVIFISVGIMSFKYGLTSPIAISTIIFGVIYFFDVAVDILPNPIGAINNFPTLASAIILVTFILKEVMRR